MRETILTMLIECFSDGEDLYLILRNYRVTSNHWITFPCRLTDGPKIENIHIGLATKP